MFLFRRDSNLYSVKSEVERRISVSRSSMEPGSLGVWKADKADKDLTRVALVVKVARLCQLSRIEVIDDN